MASLRFCRKEMSPATREVVIFGPGRMLPPGMKMAGKSRRAASFSWAGMDLSQEAERITPSQGYTEPWTSIISQMASREAKM